MGQIKLTNAGIALDESAKSMIVCGWGGITTVDLQTRAIVSTLPGLCRSMTASGETPARVCALTANGRVLLWDLTNRTSFTVPVTRAIAASISRDGKRLAVGDAEDSVHFCRVDSSNVTCSSVWKM